MLFSTLLFFTILNREQPATNYPVSTNLLISSLCPPTFTLLEGVTMNFDSTRYVDTN